MSWYGRMKKSRKRRYDSSWRSKYQAINWHRLNDGQMGYEVTLKRQLNKEGTMLGKSYGRKKNITSKIQGKKWKSNHRRRNISGEMQLEFLKN